MAFKRNFKTDHMCLATCSSGKLRHPWPFCWLFSCSLAGNCGHSDPFSLRLSFLLTIQASPSASRSRQEWPVWLCRVCLCALSVWFCVCTVWPLHTNNSFIYSSSTVQCHYPWYSALFPLLSLTSFILAFFCSSIRQSFGPNVKHARCG